MDPRFRSVGGWILPIGVAAFIVVHAILNFTASAGGSEFEAALSRLRAVHGIIQDRYVRPVESEKIVEGALHGMMGALDSHCVYFNAREFQEFMVDTKGEFGGIGIEIDVREGLLTVITPIEDSPAAKAGILAGDVILKIDGESAEGITMERAISRIRGKEGTTVTLQVLHRGKEDPVDLRVVRGIIHVQSVKGARLVDPDAKIGYIRVTAFQDNTAAAFKEAVQKLQGQGMRALVMDLRFNGGGLLDEAVSLADLFVDDGVIVSTRGRRASDQRIYRGRHEGTFAPPLLLAVLVNEASASASEIFAGAIKDYGLGTLVGQRTYGKASVQTVVQLRELLPGESEGAGLKITTAHYFTPKGFNLNREEGKKEYGLEPDILVPLTPSEEREILVRRTEEEPGAPKRAEEKDKQLARALDELRKKLGTPGTAPGSAPGPGAKPDEKPAEPPAK